MTRLLVVGVAVMDFVFYVDAFPAGGMKHRARDAAVVGGGCAANAAVAIARLGGEALLSTRLGGDQVGRMIHDELAWEGVDLSLTDRSGARSSYSSILIDCAGERQIMNFRGEALLQTPEHLATAPPVSAVLADTRWSEGALAAMMLARDRDVPGVLDVEAPAEIDAFGPASHLAFSEQGLAHFYPGLAPDVAINRVLREHGGWVCVTMGAGGVLWCSSEGKGHVPGFSVDVVDTLGAGDVWHGAFALNLAEGAGETEAIRFANAVAALKCTRRGGRAGSPSRKDVETFMKETAGCN
jgi:sulfofructose kinase